MRSVHSYFLSILLCFLLLGCEKENKDLSRDQNSAEDLVQMEQNDEKTQISDSNLPLPIEDEASESFTDPGLNLSVVNALYKKKCSSCHGKKAELKIGESRVIKNLDKRTLIESLKVLEKNKDKNHILELSQRQIESLAEFIIRQDNE